MGDAETEVVLPRIESDLFDLFEGVAHQTLNEKIFSVTPKTATTVMLVSGGYPEAYEKGKAIQGLTISSQSELFHAGTRLEEETVVTSGGRVLAVTSYGEDFQEALKQSYNTIEQISFEGMNYRKDLGFDL